MKIKSTPLITVALVAIGMAAIFFKNASFRVQEKTGEEQDFRKSAYRMASIEDTTAQKSWRDIPLTDQNGKRFTIRKFSGRPVLIGFVFSGCIVYCPVQTGALTQFRKQLIDELGHSDFEFVSITMTPDFDSPESLKKFAIQFSADKENWRFATGSSADVQALIDKFEVRIRRGKRDQDVLHTTDVFVLDKETNIQKSFEGIPLDRHNLLTEMLALF